MEKMTKSTAKFMEKMTKSPQKNMEKMTNTCLINEKSIYLPVNYVIQFYEH